MIKTKKAITRDYSRVVLTGEPSCGKTTAAINWNNNGLWIDLDDRIPSDCTDKCTLMVGIKNHSTLMAELNSVYNEDSIDYKSIVLDTFTIVERMAEQHCVTMDFKGDKNNYADYSKGDKKFLPPYILEILNLLDKIAKKHGCDVILICHSDVKPVKNPNGETYDKCMLDLTGNVRNMVLRWADLIGFAWNDVSVVSSGLKKVADSSIRKISFSNNPRFDAKGRAEIPEEIPFDKDGEWIKLVKPNADLKTIPKKDSVDVTPRKTSSFQKSK